MIFRAQNKPELAWLLAFLHEHAGVVPSAQTHAIGWVEHGDIKLAVGFDGWIGKTCQMHVALATGYHFTPRAMLINCFRHAFVDCKRELVLGVVNSLNERAFRYDQHLGFTELLRLPMMHDDGGDIVVMGMHKHQCRYLEIPVLENEVVGHA